LLFELVKKAPASLRYESGLILADENFVIIHSRFSGHGRPRNWIAADGCGKLPSRSVDWMRRRKASEVDCFRVARNSLAVTSALRLSTSARSRSTGLRHE
jgi:hypothetical protein